MESNTCAISAIGVGGSSLLPPPSVESNTCAISAIGVGGSSSHLPSGTSSGLTNRSTSHRQARAIESCVLVLIALASSFGFRAPSANTSAPVPNAKANTEIGNAMAMSLPPSSKDNLAMTTQVTRPTTAPSSRYNPALRWGSSFGPIRPARPAIHPVVSTTRKKPATSGALFSSPNVAIAASIKPSIPSEITTRSPSRAETHTCFDRSACCSAAKAVRSAARAVRSAANAARSPASRVESTPPWDVCPSCNCFD